MEGAKPESILARLLCVKYVASRILFYLVCGLMIACVFSDIESLHLDR